MLNASRPVAIHRPKPSSRRGEPARATPGLQLAVSEAEVREAQPAEPCDLRRGDGARLHNTLPGRRRRLRSALPAPVERRDGGRAADRLRTTVD